MKKLLLVFASVLLVSCQEKNEAYYWQHPDLLQKKLQACPQSMGPKELHCEQLQAIASQMQTLAYELGRDGPQQFGKRILALEQQIAQDEAKLKNNPDAAALKDQLEKDKQQHMQRMAIIKKYESPEG